jgi:AsmA protein
MSEAVSSPSLATPSRAHRIKQAAWIGLGVVGLLLATVLIVPTFIDLGLFKSTYLPLVEDALNRRVDVNEVRLSLVPTPSIRLSSLRVSDGPTPADNTFFSAQQVRLQLKFLPLLRGRFEITELILEKPVFNLMKQADGSFNDAEAATKRKPPGVRRDIRKKPSSTKSAEAAPVPIIIPSRMSIHDGQLSIVTKGQTPVYIKGIDLSLEEFSGDRPFPFRASFDYPGLKTISLEGEIDYQENKALIELKKNRLKIQDLNLPLQGTVSNLSTTPRFDLTLNGENADAKSIFEILSVFGLAPRDTEVSGPMGVFLSIIGPANNLTTQVRGLFKDVKVNGKRALKGRLSGQISIRLPLGGGAVARRLEGDGKLTARDGELTNVDLIAKIQRVTGMIGLSKDQRREATTFQKLEANFILGGGHAEFTRLYLINPQMEVNGSGTMTLEQPTLDMALSTALSAQASARAGRVRTAAFFKDKRGRVVVPLKVTGPLEKPSVSLNTGKLAEIGLPPNVEKGFGAFFKQLFRSR